MQKTWLAAAIAATLTLPDLAFAVGSCGEGGPMGETVSVEHAGSVYYVSTPPSYDAATAWPLILGLHGDEGDPASSVNFFWRDVVDDRFIFVAPKAPNASGSWYEETESNSAWMDDLVASVLDQYNVDLDRIYIWGLSGGAVFSSDYALARQDFFAAVEFNMGGSARGYAPAPSEACRIPARFVVSETDFLRENALGLFDELTAAGHETVWLDANCEDHCFDEELAGPAARDWLLGFSLCGATPSAGCREGTPGDSEPLDSTSSTATTATSTGTSSTVTTGTSTNGMGTTLGSSTGGAAGTTAGGATAAQGAATTNPTAAATTSDGSSATGAAATGAGGTGLLTDTSTGSPTTTDAGTYVYPTSATEPGCSCRAMGSSERLPGGYWWLTGMLLTLSAARRRLNTSLR